MGIVSTNRLNSFWVKGIKPIIARVKALEEHPSVTVINDLTSDSTTDALSAAQGKALNTSLTSTNSALAGKASSSIYTSNGINYWSDGIGTCCLSMGTGSKANGTYSFALGGYAKVIGTAGHAFGSDVEVTGQHGCAIGQFSVASGGRSMAFGFRAKASNYASCAIGKNNKGMAGTANTETQTGDVFVVGNGTSGTSLSNAFRITYTGEIYGTKNYQASGADYAEFVKPWADGNPNEEDRVGYFVTVKNGLLEKANDGDFIVGITSGNPSVVGNSDEDYYWRYERDVFNRIVMEDVPELVEQKDEEGNTVYDEETHEPIMVATGKIIKNARMKLTDDYDPSLQDSYVERKNRKEWDYVGMVGVVPVRDDGTCIAGGLCKCGYGGIATLTMQRGFDTYLVLERITDHVVSVLLKS